MNSNQKVFVYGSLLSGLHNHRVISDGTLLGEHETDAEFVMYSLGGFPGVMKNGNTVIKGEVYDVNDSTFKGLDRLEGYNPANPDTSFYVREQIPTPYGDAWIYLLREGSHNYASEEVDDGDWREHYTNQRQTY